MPKQEFNVIASVDYKHSKGIRTLTLSADDSIECDHAQFDNFLLQSGSEVANLLEKKYGPVIDWEVGEDALEFSFGFKVDLGWRADDDGSPYFGTVEGETPSFGPKESKEEALIAVSEFLDDAIKIVQVQKALYLANPDSIPEREYLPDPIGY